MASWEAPVPLPGNRVPGKTEPCTAADRPLGRRASSGVPDRFGTTDVPASTMTGTLADPRDPLTREILPAGRIFHLAQW